MPIFLLYMANLFLDFLIDFLLPRLEPFLPPFIGLFLNLQSRLLSLQLTFQSLQFPSSFLEPILPFLDLGSALVVILHRHCDSVAVLFHLGDLSLQGSVLNP